MPADNKALVTQWFALGLSTDEALTLVHPDIAWHLPETIALALTGDPGPARGPDGMRWVTRMSNAVYAERRPSQIDFVVADGDWVVMQLTVTSQLHTGDYRNRYVFTIRCQDGLVREVFEQLDSKRFFDLALSPPDVLAALLARIEAAG